MNRYVDAPPRLLTGLLRGSSGVCGLIDGECNSNNPDEYAWVCGIYVGASKCILGIKQKDDAPVWCTRGTE